MASLQVSYDDRGFWDEFIKLYRSFPILWSTADDGVPKQSKHLRDRARNILLRKYRERQPEATAGTVKKAVRALRASYRKELRMALEQECATEYESPWWCFAELNFLRSTEEETLKIELIKEEDKSCVSFDASHIRVDGSRRNIEEHEDDMDIYCRTLAMAMRQLSEEQLNYTKCHIGTILNAAKQGLLSRYWPQDDHNHSRKAYECPTTSGPQRVTASVHTVKGIVRFGKRSATQFQTFTELSPNKRVKGCTEEEGSDLPLKESEYERLQTDLKAEQIMPEATDIAEDIILEDSEELKYEHIPSDYEAESLPYEQVGDVEPSMENIEITLIDLHNGPENSGGQTFDSTPAETITTNGKSLMSVRLPSGPTLRRQCTMHSSIYVDNLVPNYNDEEFLRQFRVGRDVAQMLSQHLETAYSYKKLKGHGGYEAISAQTHILAFLWFLGREKASYRDVADRFELSVSCLHDVIWRVCDSILSMQESVIVRPDDERKSTSATYFAQLCTFPGVIGCVDGTQIKIDKPIENSERYLLRKGYYSMQLQAIIDEDRHFVDVFVEYPGEPEMLAGVKNLCDDQYCLLGGKGYPCLPQLLVPYRSDGTALTKAQKAYNEQLQMVQRCSYGKVFQNLKHRFRQLYHLKGRQLSRIVKLIKVCCVLHNLAAPADMVLLDREANEHGDEPYRSASVFTYTSGNQSESEIALGLQQRDAICANFIATKHQ